MSMTILNFDECNDKAHWLAEIKKCDWRAGAYLYGLLKDGQLKARYGERTRALLLTEGESLISFCTYAGQDEIADASLTPWAGFVYTFPAYRGRRLVGLLLERARELARQDGWPMLYVSTEENGLYEKYGFTYWKTMQTVYGSESRVYRKSTAMNALVINCSPVRTGATAEIVRLAADELSSRYRVQSVCIDDYAFGFCTGCRRCHDTARCFQHDGAEQLMAEMDAADIIVAVSPSYWADVPGQFKAFIDRCTPWCNTHEPHAALRPGKKGYAIALRTGPGMKECERVIGSIEHFYGHLEIACCGSLGLCAVERKEDVKDREAELLSFCAAI